MSVVTLEVELYRIVFVRHGESQYNVLKKFAGWLDCDLTADGIMQARKAGRLLKDSGYSFDVAYTSKLKRANETLRHLLDEMNLDSTSIFQSWRLNERHYGALDDLTREEAELKFGKEILRQCRENFRCSPPILVGGKNDHFGGQYSMPNSESMFDVTARCLLYWNSVIIPAMTAGKSVLVVTHGELLRLLTGSLLEMDEEDIILTPVLPNASPLVFDLREDFSVSNHFFLSEIGDPSAAVDIK
jgi:2,3-bisphosphoglycerate-dependent phosphoglycerate mutase